MAISHSRCCKQHTGKNKGECHCTTLLLPLLTTKGTTRLCTTTSSPLVSVLVASYLRERCQNKAENGRRMQYNGHASPPSLLFLVGGWCVWLCICRRYARAATPQGGLLFRGI